jgi:hypothetical protein
MADKDKQPTQADFEKAWKRIKSGKGRLPMEDDMGPMGFPAPAQMPELKTKDTGDKNEFDIKGVLPQGYENAKPVKKGGAIKTKKMASGGKVSQLAKANGIAVKGKSRGRII